jgi:amino acid transporter
MAQDSVAQTEADLHGDEHVDKKHLLGPLLCWAVVFADIGTSIYYVPGILYHSVQGLAGFFVFLTMSVFVLLSLKYAEVTHRFPQGGGVVTVAGQALNRWFGALGGMFILVDYFLTAAISCISGIFYLSVVAPAFSPYALWITIGVLALLGLLNWVGISESAKVSLVGAVIAFVSDIAILVTVFSHISFADFLVLINKAFASHTLTGIALLIGFANSFLAFSGLESISQLSPVMKRPHKKVAGLALFLVVITIGLTSPLLTLFATILLPGAAQNELQRDQIISLLAGHWGNTILQAEVAISASALLVFASNTAIIGAYHVFLALSRMEFLPEVILKRNKLRGTPHYAIILATGIPVLVLLFTRGNTVILGDMYAFGLLGAFTLTCLGLDIVRYRDWKRVRKARRNRQTEIDRVSLGDGQRGRRVSTGDLQLPAGQAVAMSDGTVPVVAASVEEVKGTWFKIDFVLGVLTTFLVAIAWSTNLVSKPLATAFGGGVAILGMAIAYFNYVHTEKAGRVPVPVVVNRVDERIPDSVLAIMVPGDEHHNAAVMRAAVNNAREYNRPLVFLYIGERKARETAPRMMEIVDPYLEDQQAKESFGRAERLALKQKLPTRKYIYLQGDPAIVTQIWQRVHPHDTVIAAGASQEYKDISPDRIRYEITPDGKVAHLLKQW